jgi:hypothetical protein
VAHEYEYVEADDDWKNAFIPSVARRPREVVKAMFSLKPQAKNRSKGRAAA